MNRRRAVALSNAKITALPASTANIVSGLTTLVADARSTLAQVKSVAPPSSLSGAVKTWLGVVGQSSVNAGKIVSAVTAGDKSQVQSLASQGSALNSQANAEAKALGLPSWAVNADPSGG